MLYIMVKGGGASFYRQQSHTGSKAIRCNVHRIYLAAYNTWTKDVMLEAHSTKE